MDIKAAWSKRSEVLKKVRGIAFSFFESEDVVRHPLVQRIVGAYESYKARSKKAGINDKKRKRETEGSASTCSMRYRRAICLRARSCASGRTPGWNMRRKLQYASLARPKAGPLNRNYRGKDHATNVLTFVFRDEPPFEGDLALCAPVIAREAREQGKSIAAHYAHLVVHGVLHLQGYDHENDADARIMEKRESQIVGSLGFADPYEKDEGGRMKAKG